MITLFNLLKFSRRKKRDRHSEAGNVHFIYYTPENERLQPKNSPNWKKKNIFQTSLLGLKMFIFQGVIYADMKITSKHQWYIVILIFLILLCKHVEIILETAGNAGVMFISNKDEQGHSSSWINWPELPLAQLFFGNKASFCTTGHPTSWWKRGCFISEWSV